MKLHWTFFFTKRTLKNTLETEKTNKIMQLYTILTMATRWQCGSCSVLTTSLFCGNLSAQAALAQ